MGPVSLTVPAHSPVELADMLAGLGAAQILTAGRDDHLQIDRHSGMDLSLTISGVAAKTAARLVRDHARDHNRAGSWMQMNADADGLPLFSTVRTSCSDWAGLEQERREVEAGLGTLDQAMTAGLGWPKVWAGLDAPGRSPLDMQTTRSGADIIRARLRKIAVQVADLDEATVLAQVADLRPGPWSLGTTITPTTAVRAWCALWGLSLFPVSRDPSGTQPTIPARAWTPVGEWVAMPGWTGALDLATLKATIGSVWWQAAAFESAPLGQDPLAPGRTGILARDVTAAKTEDDGTVTEFTRQVVSVPVSGRAAYVGAVPPLRDWLPAQLTGLIVWPVQTTRTGGAMDRQVLAPQTHSMDGRIWRPQVVPSGAAVIDVPAVAALLGVKETSVHRYRVRDDTFPAPDVVLSGHPGWLPERITAWKATRPGRGAGGGRPRKNPRV
jgi:predicted DNA-binding transcriptional regulator AlpA